MRCEGRIGAGRPGEGAIRRRAVSIGHGAEGIGHGEELRIQELRDWGVDRNQRSEADEKSGER